MRYKEHTVRKLEGQSSKLKSLQRSIQMTAVTGQQAVEILEQVIKEINLVIDRLGLERDE